MVFGTKQKGRRLQKQVAVWLADYFGLKVGGAEDLRSTPMGSSGPDVLLQTREAQNKIAFSIECSNSENFSLKKLEQAYNNGIDKRYNDRERWPVLFYKRNGWRPVAVLDAETFIQLASRASMDDMKVYNPNLGGARKGE